MGDIVKSFVGTWFEGRLRKPPDPKEEVRHLKRRRLRQLQATLLVWASSPTYVRASDSMLLQAMVASKQTLSTLSATTLQAMHKTLRDTTEDTTLSSLNGFQVICDSGCSRFSTFDVNDFVPGTFQPATGQKTVLQGIAGGLQIDGTGLIDYEVLDDYGRIKHLRGAGLLMKDLPVRLLPPQIAMANDNVGFYRINGDSAKFVFSSDGGFVNTPLDPSSNLPMVTAFLHAEDSAEKLHQSLYSCVTSENNQNLTPTQKETLRWHWRLGHPSMAVIRWLGERGLLGPMSGKLSKASDAPMCATCHYGKQTRRPTGTTKTIVRPDKEGGIRHDKLDPGDEIAVDQFETKQRGRKFDTGGKERDEDKFCGGTIFTDVATGFTRVYFQVSLGGPETLKSKLHFEREAMVHGVSVRNYRSDNGIFTKAEFLSEIENRGQGLSVSGVGAHHQNGVAERAIRTVVTKARTMLLHAQLRWPEQTTTDLWPMAMQHAAYLVNIVPNVQEGWSPEEKFSRSLSGTNHLHNLPVWGCPTYVLQPTLQGAQKLPKWQPRSRRAQYLGWSPLHASNVALVRNLATGRISPQFHVIFDNWFETIATDDDETIPENWDILVINSQFESNIDIDDGAHSDLADEWLSKEELAERRVSQEQRKNRHVGGDAKSTKPDQQQSTQPLITTQDGSEEFVLQRETHANATDRNKHDVSEEKQSVLEFPPTPTPAPAQLPPLSTTASDPILSPRRSKRERKAPQRFGYDGTGVSGYLLFQNGVYDMLRTDQWSAAATIAYWTLLCTNPSSGLLEHFEPAYTALALKALKRKKGKKHDPDSPNFQEAMVGPHRIKFQEAMIKEVRSLEEKGTWQAMLRSAVPEGAQVIPLTWVFKIKRLPNGEFAKFKARLCVRGDLQDEEGITYAPVVKWATVRSVLAFALKQNLKTRMIDFTNAFVQSSLPVEEQIYVSLPKGFGHANKDTVLQLKKSLYGLVRAPYHWFNSLRDSMLAIGFEQSKNDPCLFIDRKRRIIVVVYVDDCLCFGYEDSDLDDLVGELKERHQLDEQKMETDVFAYLGIELDLRGNTVELLQKGLTEKILKAVNMSDCNPNETPAKEEPLSADDDGEPFKEDWEYASVVGMLMYLVHTRPDIQFAVHQCAKFTHNPKASHANAVKKICRYLKGTESRGLRFTKSIMDGEQLRVNCYVDASFAPLWNYEHADNPASSKSRTGYIIRIDDVPISWCSSGQGETALSTTEAEYIALSTAMRELLWVRRVVREIAEGFGIGYDRVSKIRPKITSKVFEDNMGAIAVANKPALTSRTRHLHTKYHHFKENLGVTDGDGIVIEYIKTEEQLADLLTKGVGNKLFKPLRDKLMGWTDMEEKYYAREGDLESTVSALHGQVTSGPLRDSKAGLAQAATSIKRVHWKPSLEEATQGEVNRTGCRFDKAKTRWIHGYD